MGILNLFSAPPPIATLNRLPSGTFTIDRAGHVVASTLPQSFSSLFGDEIGRLVLSMFRSSQKHGMPLAEVTVNYAGLKITARDLRGGAIIFLAPREN